MRFSSSRMFPGHQYRLEDLQRRVGDAAHRLAELAAVALEEQPRQLREIVDALAQRRHADRNDVDPVVQVLAEPAVLHRLLEIDVGRRHQAEVGLDRLQAADALDLAFLNRPQQLGLQVEAQVADLVEEQRASGRELELAELLLVRAGERAALVAEQRALDQFVRDGGEIDGDERRLAAARLAVHQPREQLLAGAALAEDQDRRRQPGDLLHQIDDVADLLARADQELALALLGDLRGQGDHLAVQVLALAGVAHQRAQLVVVEVLGDVVVGAVLHRLHRGLDLVDRRDHDAFDEVVVLLDDAQDVEAADAGQTDVEQDQVDVLVFEEAERGLAARDGEDVVVPLEDGGDRVPHPLIVVADENRLSARHGGWIVAFSRGPGHLASRSGHC